ncbi:MAG TPA: diguanylate cyclase, partial [Methylococcaceae bacterium]|nr:diguanylate cyclase [Methylococcaceae bacterium]
DSAERRLVLSVTDRSNEAAHRDRVERDLFLDQKILDEMPLAYCIADAQGTIGAVNSRFVKLMGRPADQLIGTGIADWIDRPVKTQGPIYQGDYALVAEPSGRVAKLSTLPFQQGDYALVAEPTGRVVKLSTLPLLTQQGGSEYVYFFDDITAFKQRALTDNAELERLQRTLDGVEDGIITTNADGFIQYMNPFAQRLTGLVEHQYKGMAFGQVIHLIDEKKREPLVDPATRAIRIGKTVKFRQDVLLIGEHKQELAVDVAATPVHDRTKTVIGSVIVMKDVAEQRSLSHQMHMHASLDPLTGLINRRELLSLLQRLQSETEERSRQHTLCYMDLDKFKVVNDTCGHNAGDELLRQVSNLMSECLRANDVLARIGGDEFCAVLLNTATEHGAAVAEKIRDAVKRFRFTWDGKFFEIGVSIGLFGLQPGLGVEETISAADQACYHAKEQGRDRVYVASAPQRDKGTPPPAPWSERLSAAADHDYFRLFSWDAQALQAGHQSAPTYREVLLQLHEPNQAPLTASAFMPSAQRLNLVPSIERWGIGKLLSRLPPAAPPLDPPVVHAIHLSSVTLADSSFTAFLFEQSKHFGISPQQICFEISEDDLVQNFSLVQSFMLAGKKAGYRFCLGQFGGGISSFGYIRNLPLDFLKIDSSLTGRAGSDPIDAAIVRAIQDIGEHMHVRLVAQNVQDQSTREFLSALGIHYGQGPLFSQPIPLEPARPAPSADAGRQK